MTSVTNEDVVTRLNSLGLPPENMVLLPVSSEREGLIGLWYPEFGFRYLIIENDELAKACYTYLLNRGARRFDSEEELRHAIATEKWPGWDSCEPSARERGPGRDPD